MFSKKTVLSIVLLLFCIFVPLIFICNPFFIHIREGLTSDSSQKIYTNVDDYFNDTSQKIQQLEDVYNDIVNGSQSKYPLSVQYKRKKMDNVILTINDYDKYKYQSILKKAIEDVTVTDDAAVMKTTRGKESDIKTEIASNSTTNSGGNMTDEQIHRLVDNNAIKAILQDKMDDKGRKYIQENPDNYFDFMKKNFTFYDHPEKNQITVIRDSWGGKNYDLLK
jgi:hypothetical protein